MSTFTGWIWTSAILFLGGGYALLYISGEDDGKPKKSFTLKSNNNFHKVKTPDDLPKNTEEFKPILVNISETTLPTQTASEINEQANSEGPILVPLETPQPLALAQKAEPEPKVELEEVKEPTPVEVVPKALAFAAPELPKLLEKSKKEEELTEDEKVKKTLEIAALNNPVIERVLRKSKSINLKTVAKSIKEDVAEKEEEELKTPQEPPKEDKDLKQAAAPVITELPEKPLEIVDAPRPTADDGSELDLTKYQNLDEEDIDPRFLVESFKGNYVGVLFRGYLILSRKENPVWDIKYKQLQDYFKDKKPSEYVGSRGFGWFYKSNTKDELVKACHDTYWWTPHNIWMYGIISSSRRAHWHSIWNWCTKPQYWGQYRPESWYFRD